MANYIEIMKAKHYQEINITEVGFVIVPIYGSIKLDDDKKKWIENNLEGIWTSFRFGMPKDGHGYCFKNEDDAMAFKLRWS